MLALAILSLSAVWLYHRYDSTVKLPTLPATAGSVHLYFDQAGVAATLEVQVDHPRTSPYYNYQVRLNSPVTTPLGYHLVLTGNARPAHTFPAGTPADIDSHGCFRETISVVLSGRYRCSEGKDVTVGYLNTALDPDADAVHGYIEPGRSFAEVSVFSYLPVSHPTGKYTYFKLPSFGTTYLPPGGDRVAIPIVDDLRAHIPATLTVQVNDGSLDLDQRPENVSPGLVDSGILFWYQADTSSLLPQGTLVDTRIEDRQQVTQFYIALAAGAIITLALGSVRLAWIGLVELLSSRATGFAIWLRRRLQISR